MKILIINTLYYPYQVGGAEVSVQLLAEELVRQGNSVKVVALNENNYIERKIINDVQVVYVPLKNIYWPYSGKRRSFILKLIWHLIDNYNPWMKKCIAEEINTFNPDLIHTNNIAGFSVSCWDVAFYKKIKIIHTIRDYYLYHPNCTLYKNGAISKKSLSVIFWSFIKKEKASRVDRFVGISKFITKFHTEDFIFNKSKQKYIYNSIRSYKVSGNYHKKIRVGFIGRLTEEKGFPDFCQLVDILEKKYSFEYLVAGKLPTYFNRKKYNTKIQFLDFIPIEKFLDSVDIVVLPLKWNEPFGRVVAECALANKIVLVNKVGGVTELSEIFENVMDISSFQWGNAHETLDSLLKDKEFSEFRIDTVAHQYLEQYKKLICKYEL